MKPRIAVYTANFSDYDEITNPVVVNPEVDYLYFTDSPTASSSVWQIVHVNPPCSTPQHSSRYYFDQSCLVAPDYDVTLMHGANSRLLYDPVELVNRCLSLYADMAIFKHPHRAHVLDEFNAVVQMGKDTEANVAPQRERYAKEGLFESGIGLSACIFMIRRNNQAVAEFEHLWWHEVENGSHRDQLAFDYVRWKTGIAVAWIPGDCFSSGIIRVGVHR